MTASSPLHRAAPVPLTSSGWTTRRAEAERRRDAWRESDADPRLVAIRRVRAAGAALHEAEGRGSMEWHALNDPAACPITGRPAAMHPQKAAALREFIASQGWGSDPLAPITPTATKAEFQAKHSAALRADYEAAGRDLEALEAEMHETRPVPVAPAVKAAAPVAALTTIPEEPVKRGRGRPPKALAAALAAEGLDTDD